MIPKIIWQCNKWEYSNMPKHLWMHSQDYISLNPNFEYKYVSDTKMGKMMKKYSKKYDSIILKFWNDQRIPKSYKSDLWRALCLYENGGAFFDADTQIYHPLDEQMFEDNKILLSRVDYDKNTKSYSTANGVFAIERKNNIMLSYIYFFIETIKYYYENYIDIYRSSDDYTKTKNGELANWVDVSFPFGVSSWSSFFSMSLHFFNSNNLYNIKNYAIKEYFIVQHIETLEDAKKFKFVKTPDNDNFIVLHGPIFKKNHFRIDTCMIDTKSGIKSAELCEIGIIRSSGPWWEGGRETL